jgi:hypothetical protein
MFRHGVRLSLLALVATAAACQSESKAPPKKTGALDASTTTFPSTFPSSSPGGLGSTSGSIQITSNFGTSLSAQVGIEAYWVFSARNTSGTTETMNITVTVNPQPPAMTISPPGADSVTIRWTPQQTDLQQYRSGTVNVSVSTPSGGSASQSFSWTLGQGTGVGGGGGLSGLGGGGGGLLSLLPQVLGLITGSGGGGGGFGDILQKLLGAFTGGGAGSNPFSNFGQGGGFGNAGQGGFGGVGAGNNNFGNFNNGAGQPGAGNQGGAGGAGGGFGGGAPSGGGWSQ